MNRARAVAALAVAVLFAAGGVGSAHTGGTTAYASIVVDGAGVRYRLTLWPAAVPPAVAVQLRAAGADDAASREGLMEVIRNKVTLVADGRRCTPGAGSVVASSGPDESITLGVEFDCGP
ncbi:MAG TPA: hypothetical protein VNN07_14275, partial [Candidatus Tectomicrobia bacterium]|nr:hypothetical protein [Candidatus Tectomicrobia bacterium]